MWNIISMINLGWFSLVKFLPFPWRRLSWNFPTWIVSNVGRKICVKNNRKDFYATFDLMSYRIVVWCRSQSMRFREKSPNPISSLPFAFSLSFSLPLALSQTTWNKLNDIRDVWQKRLGFKMKLLHRRRLKVKAHYFHYIKELFNLPSLVCVLSNKAEWNGEKWKRKRKFSFWISWYFPLGNFELSLKGFLCFFRVRKFYYAVSAAWNLSNLESRLCIYFFME